MLIEDKDERLLEALDYKLKHVIHIWGHKRYHHMSETIKITATFSMTPYFLPHLLTFLLERPCFHFGCCSFKIVGLDIGRAESRSREVVVNFSGYSL